MANFNEVRGHSAQRDRAQEWQPNPNNNGKLRRYILALAIGAAIVAVAVAGIILSRAEETTATAHHLGDHSNMLHIGHLLLTEWDISGMSDFLSDEIKIGDSVLEVHNDGQTVHRFAIWRGGVLAGDQVVGGTLVAETSYIQPGGLSSLKVDLEAGDYVLVCSVRGHLERGMYGTIKLQ